MNIICELNFCGFSSEVLTKSMMHKPSWQYSYLTTNKINNLKFGKLIFSDKKIQYVYVFVLIFRNPDFDISYTWDSIVKKKGF
jgi:hypothetical protein